MNDWGVLAFLCILALAVAYLVVMQFLRIIGRDPSTKQLHTTGVGLVFWGVFTVGLFAGLATPRVAPSSWLGVWISEHGLLAYFAILGVWFVIGGAILALIGYPDMKRPEK